MNLQNRQIDMLIDSFVKVDFDYLKITDEQLKVATEKWFLEAQ